MGVRVGVVSDRLLVREGLRALLAQQPRLVVRAAVDDLRPLLSLLRREPLDVVLFDAGAGDLDGVAAAAQLRCHFPDLPTVNLVEELNVEVLVNLLEEGVERRGILLVDRLRMFDDVVDAVLEVSRGGSVVDPKVIETILRRPTDRDPALARLTPRETEVLAAMAEGLNNAAIAVRLYLSERAVEKHINAIFSKLDVAEADSHRRVRAVLRWLNGDRLLAVG